MTVNTVEISRSKESLRLWLKLLSCENIIAHSLRTKLREEFAITLPQFDVLAELEYARNPLTMSELSQQLMVSNGNVTGVVDRLEKNGLAQRTASKGDRRVLLIALTKEGRSLFKKIAKKHEQWVSDIFDFLPEGDLLQLSSTLQQVYDELKTLKSNNKL